MYSHSSLSSGLPASNRDRQHTTSFSGTLSVNGSRQEYFRGNNFKSAVKHCLFYSSINMKSMAKMTQCLLYTYYLIYNLRNYCFFSMNFVTSGNGCDCANVMDSNRLIEVTMAALDQLMDLVLLLPQDVRNLKHVTICRAENRDKKYYS